MQLSTYSDLRDSNVPWIQSVPSHWTQKRLKFVVELVNQKQSVDQSDLPYIGLEHIESWTGRKIDGEISQSEGLASTYASGDVLFGKLRPYLAKIHLADTPGLVSSEALVIRPSRDISSSFLKYYFLSRDFINTVDSSTYGSKMPRASWDYIGNLPLLVPSAQEQQAIVDFLNHKTAQIDALIAKKQSLLDKLAEQRTALISQAVTKGLDPSVATRDSGAAWLDKIPEHWSTSRVKFVAKVGNGSTPSRDNPDYWFDGDFPWLNSSVVNREVVDSADQFVTGVALKECHLPIIEPPAVLVGITGQGKTRGMSSKLTFRATINQHLVYVKPYGDSINVDYLHHIFERAYAYLRNESDAGGSTKGAITCSQIENLAIPLPPVAEQEQIVRFVDGDYSRISRLQKKVKAALQRLQEYRAALITNAVTGKIDVRDFCIPTTTEQREVAHG